MTHLVSAPNAAAAATQYLEISGRKLAYRVVGAGKPLVLCNRFRGVLDTWDPLFIDSLAAQGFQVVTFDYSGLGLSSGEKSYNPPALVKDARELILGLGLKDVAIGGWSLGGIVAQVYLAMFGAEISHVVLLGTTPPGQLVKPAEQLFYDTAAKPGVNLDQFTTVFFEPADEGSRAASRRSLERILLRSEDRSPDIDAEWAISQIGREPRNPRTPHLSLNNLAAIIRAVEHGVGIAVLPDYCVAANSGLVRLLPQTDMPSMDCFLVYAEEMKNVARVQAFRDFLVSKAQRWRY